MWEIDTEYNEDGQPTERTVRPINFDWEKFEKAEKVPFQLKDDDGILMYRGQMDRHTAENGSGDAVGAPLDWAEADSGCTSLWMPKGPDFNGDFECVIG